MLSYLFPPATKTRFENTPELKDLVKIVAELRIQENKLLKLTGSNAASSTYKKSKVLSEIMSKINKSIDEFNELKTNSVAQEFSATLVLIVKIRKIIGNYLELHKDILSEKRNNNKEKACTAIGATALAGSIGVGIATGSLLLGAAAAGSYDFFICDTIIQAVALDDKRTRTMQLLEDTIKITEVIQSSLEFVNNDLASGSKLQDSFPLHCPITTEKMKNPVLCTLDGRLYEKSAIVEWLNQKRSSPFNRKPMEEKQTIEQVLIDNISLRDAIQELETQFKKSLKSDESVGVEEQKRNMEFK